MHLSSKNQQWIWQYFPFKLRVLIKRFPSIKRFTPRGNVWSSNWSWMYESNSLLNRYWREVYLPWTNFYSHSLCFRSSIVFLLWFKHCCSLGSWSSFLLIFLITSAWGTHFWNSNTQGTYPPYIWLIFQFINCT